jgi:hypothetical protein
MLKFANTLRLCASLLMARTFGRYLHSGWNGDVEYARYEWRGREWVIPTGPADYGAE